MYEEGQSPVKQLSVESLSKGVSFRHGASNGWISFGNPINLATQKIVG